MTNIDLDELERLAEQWWTDGEPASLVAFGTAAYNALPSIRAARAFLSPKAGEKEKEENDER